MDRQRIIVGSTDPVDELTRRVATELRDAGFEVVFVGPDQTPEQLIHAALAEDATEIIVAADEAAMERLHTLRAELDLDGVRITPARERLRGPRSPR